MKKRAYLEWLVRQHEALKTRVSVGRSSRDAGFELTHLKKEKLRIKDQIAVLVAELEEDECGMAS